jgi:hypothetical protein
VHNTLRPEARHFSLQISLISWNHSNAEGPPLRGYEGGGGEWAMEWRRSITHCNFFCSSRNLHNSSMGQSIKKSSWQHHATQHVWQQYSYEIYALKNTFQALQTFRVPSMLLVCHIVVQWLNYVLKLSSHLISQSRWSRKWEGVITQSSKYANELAIKRWSARVYMGCK